MTDKAAETDKDSQCPACGYESKNYRTMRVHYSMVHGDAADSPEDTPWRDPDLVEKLYIDQKKTMEQLAEQWGCCRSTVSRWVDIHGLEARPRQKAPPVELNDPEYLLEMYVERKLSAIKIGERLDCNETTVRRHLEKHGIDRRSRGEAAIHGGKAGPLPGELQDADWLEEQYLNKGISSPRIAKELDTTPLTVRRWLKRADIKLRPRYRRGPSHPQWKGGYEPYYGENWYTQRKKAWERDGYQCQDCGMTKSEHLEQHGQRPHVHHITPVIEHEKPEDANGLGNLVTLCQACHSKWENITLTPQFGCHTD